eukprot:gnl/TRDRNA2_/TRDRNA2_35359_c0_seq1.p1 gnl/TRDRNA2_/TRDRNA2_35359_c0~~gnl/TRDRNA2_/TRDRNA2_35359_c0_seq1.p1  ORF type:complete len:519 (+),score=65.58 gnl/TRDRNA2_/TRDRNA2_35359_c0_seq1:72-1628(+)
MMISSGVHVCRAFIFFLAAVPSLPALRIQHPTHLHEGYGKVFLQYDDPWLAKTALVSPMSSDDAIASRLYKLKLENVTAGAVRRFQKFGSLVHVPPGFVSFYHSSRNRSAAVLAAGKSSANSTASSRANSKSAGNSTADSMAGSKLAVCITGQLSRLEARSKMQNLLQTEAKRRGAENVHVFLVMETNTSFYVNSDSDISNSSICHSDFGSPTEVEAAFSPFYKSSLYQSHVEWRLNYTNFMSYGISKPWLDPKMRLSSHFRQWHHWALCSDLLKKAEEDMASKYDMVVRLRDNAIVTMPMPINTATKVLTKGCNTWHGVNDKVMISPRMYALNALEGVFAFGVRVNNGDSEAVQDAQYVMNPEMFLQTAWEALDIDYKSDDNFTIPVVDGRCVGNDTSAAGMPDHRKFCLVGAWKDCRPHIFNSSSYPTCVEKYTNRSDRLYWPQIWVNKSGNWTLQNWTSNWANSSVQNWTKIWSNGSVQRQSVWKESNPRNNTQPQPWTTWSTHESDDEPDERFE